MKNFYYVYNPKAGKPIYKHHTQQSAIAEAQRLALESRDETQEFIVLKAEYICSFEPPVRTEQLSTFSF